MIQPIYQGHTGGVYSALNYTDTIIPGLPGDYELVKRLWVGGIPEKYVARPFLL
jgi:hypothetical protein